MRTSRPVSRDKANLRLGFSDAVIAFAAPVLAFALRSPEQLLGHGSVVLLYVGLSAVMTIAVMLHHRIGATMLRYFNGFDAFVILKASAISVIFTTAALFSVNRLDGVARALPIIHFLVLALLLLVACYARGEFRFFMNERSLRASSALRRENALVIGANHCAMVYIRLAMLGSACERRVLAILDSNPELHGRSIAGCAVIDGVGSIEAIIREYVVHGVRVDTIFLAIPREDLSAAEARALARAAEIHQCRILSRDALFDEPNDDFAAPVDRFAKKAQMTQVGRRGFVWPAKRCIDAFVAVAGALMLLPFVLPGALLLLADIGWPVLFWQERLGRGGHPIRVLKFRTMTPDGQTPTALGKWLRRLRIDELPQLWNILKGEMSLVGPRPLLASEQESEAGQRLAVRPGLTGWAQVCGANLCSMEEKAALDEWYIDHASLALDARIFWLTVVVLLRGEKRREDSIAAALAARAARIADDLKGVRPVQLTLISDGSGLRAPQAPDRGIHVGSQAAM